MWYLINFIQFALVALWTAFASILVIIVAFLTFHRKFIVYYGRTVWAPVVLMLCGVRLKVSGREGVNTQKHYICVCNHESLLDIPAIFFAFPENLYFIAKKEVKKVPLLGWAMGLAGMIFIDRQNKERAMTDMIRAGELIRNGKNVISFPEGTRSGTGEILLFKRGTFMMSLYTGVEILPIAIKGAGECMHTKTLRLRPGTISVMIGAPVSPANYSFEKVELFANDVREIVKGMREKM